MKNMKRFIVLLTLILLIYSCQKKSANDNSKSESTKWIELFNDRDLSGWYTYQKQPEPTSIVNGLDKNEKGFYIDPLGLNNDPLNVFSVVTEDNEPAIRISGEVFGILVTDQIFENYHLKLEFKWGNKKYPPREDKKMDSGILYHSIGPEGAWGGVWMKSLECQVQETDCGDFISVDTVFADIMTRKDENNGRYYYDPTADTLTFMPERSYCNKSQDYENPIGDWNTIEIYTVDGKSVHVVNGKVNMRLFNSRYIIDGDEIKLSKGKIQLQSEGAEIFYRNIQLRDIKEIPRELLK